MPGAVLNDQPEAAEIPAGVEGAERLRQVANRLKAEAFDPGSGRMDYVRLADSEPYRHYRRLAAGLRTFDPNVLHGQDERMAFWLNLYNALMVDAVIRFGVRKSVNEVRGLFWRAAYQIGVLRFSLNDIEHGILRADAGHPAIPGAMTSSTASCAPTPGIRPSRGLTSPQVTHDASSAYSRSTPAFTSRSTVPRAAARPLPGIAPTSWRLNWTWPRQRFSRMEASSAIWSGKWSGSPGCFCGTPPTSEASPWPLARASRCLTLQHATSGRDRRPTC